VSGWMFLLVPAHPGSPGQRAVKRSCVCVCLLLSFIEYLAVGVTFDLCWTHYTNAKVQCGETQPNVE